MREWLHLLGPMGKPSDPPKWFERDDGDARLAHDRSLIRSAYPGLTFALNFKLRQVTLRGTITLKEEKSGIPTPIQTKIILPDDYPDREPISADDGDHFEHVADRHFYKTGVCCLWLPLETQWRRDDPEALLNYVHQVAVFFERQLMYDASSFWAWGQRGHDKAGYIEFLEERLDGDEKLIELFLPVILGGSQVHRRSKCPCKSGRDYIRCHKARVEGIKNLIADTRDIGINHLLD